MKNLIFPELRIDDFPWHLYWFDKNGILLGCNQAVADFFGFENPKAFIGRDIYQVVGQWGTKTSDLEKLKKDNMEVYSGKSIVIEEIVKKDGQENFFTSYKCPLRNESGEIIGVVGTSFNITEQKKRELALLEENKNQQLYLRNILNAKLPVNLYWMNKKSEIIGCNEQTAHAFGLASAKELIGKNVYDFRELFGWSEQMCAAIRKHDETVMKTKKPMVTEEVARLEGENRVFLSHKNPLLDDNGEVVGVFGFSADITHSKEMELTKKITAETAKEATKKAARNVTVKNTAKKPAKKILTLLVEKQLLPRKVAQHLLEQEGHDVVCVHTAHEAMEKLNDKVFDLILIDASEGIAFVKDLNTKTFIVGLTAYSDLGLKNACLNAGMQMVVNKPLSVEKIKTMDLAIKPVIDLTSVTQALGGNAELAKEMLDLLMKELPTFKNDINAAYQKQDWEMLTHHVHKLHGGLCYSGATHLKEITQNFEKQLNQKTGHYEQVYEAFLNEIDKTLKAYAQGKSL